MPIDNRRVLQNILLPETKDSARRTLTSADADEITQIFSQERLDKFVADGVLEGDWKAESLLGSGEVVNDSAFAQDFPGFEVLGQVEGMTPEKLAEMSDKDILAIKGIGPETLKAIRNYK